MIKDLLDEEQARELVSLIVDHTYIDSAMELLRKAGAIRKSADEVALDKTVKYIDEMSEITGYRRDLKQLILNYKAAMEEKKCQK